MQRLSKFDPYSIDEIEFFVQKKAKYTTLKSILVSLVIFALTVILNYSTIQHLWLKTSELPIQSSNKQLSYLPLTSNYACVIAKNESFTLPKVTMFNYNISSSTIVRNFTTPTDKFNDLEEVKNIVDGRESICFDLQNAVINDIVLLRIGVDALGNEFDFLLKAYSVEELIRKTSTPHFYYFESPEDFDTQIMVRFLVKKVRAIFYDSLAISYQPEQVHFCSNNLLMTYTTTPLFPMTTSHIDIVSQTMDPYDTTQEYFITRKNIGQILGKVLSWFSIFVLIFTFLISPLVDFNYKFELCQKIYDNEKLNKLESSLLSYVKYLLAPIKKGLFAEEVLIVAFEQLEKDLDILNMIKKQALMKSLISENSAINDLRSIQHENILLKSQDSQQIQDLFISKSIDNKYYKLENSQSDVIVRQTQLNKNHFNLEPDENAPSLNCVSAIVKSFDIGEVSVSLISNKGEGYKNHWNTILTLLCLIGVLLFLFFAGMFELTPVKYYRGIIENRDENIKANVTLNPSDIIFRVDESNQSGKFWLTAVLIDQNYELIQKLTLLNGTACNQYAVDLNESANAQWQCLNKSITLTNGGKKGQVKLGLAIAKKGFVFIMKSVQITLRQHININDTMVPVIKQISNQWDPSALYMINSQITIQRDSEQPPGSEEYFWTVYTVQDTLESQYKGTTIELLEEMIMIETSTPTIWDVIDTSWGIVILAFTVFLSKIARYLNVRERQKITRDEENESRNDIVAILSTQYKLMNQVFSNELNQVRYFFKRNYSEIENKEN